MKPGQIDARTLLILQTIQKMRHTEVQECDGCGQELHVEEDCEYNDALDAVTELIEATWPSRTEKK
jgi:hypothetical protein